MAFGRRRIAVVAVVPLLVLGACSEDPEPTFAPPSDSATPTEPSPPSPSPSVEPWEKQTKAGAVAFAKHWVDVFNESINLGESRGLRAISDPACGTCAAIVERIDAIEAHGGFYRSDGWTVLRALPANGSRDGAAIMSLRIRQAPETFKESSTASVEKSPAGKTTFSAEFEWVEKSWVMTDLSVLS